MQELCEEAVDYCLSPKVKAQDAMFTLITVAANEEGQKVYERTLLEQYPLLESKFPGMIIGRVYKAVENMIDPAVGDRVSEFVGSLSEEKRGQIERSVKQGVEALKVSAAWRARDAKSIVEFVRKH
jgi:hypothetical protein